MDAEGSEQECVLGQQKDKGEKGSKNERADHQAGTDQWSEPPGWVGFLSNLV